MRSIAFVVPAPVIAVCLLLFIRGLSKPDPSATLTGKLEKIVGDWTVNKVPVNGRVVNLVIGNADASEDVLSLPEAPAAPSLLDKLKGLLRGGASVSSLPATSFARRARRRRPRPRCACRNAWASVTPGRRSSR